MRMSAYVALPRPISTNNLFRNVPGRGRVVTPKYKEWRALTQKFLLAQSPLPRFVRPVDITLYVGEGGIGNMDSDNTAKAYIDALKSANVIHDDSRKWVRSSKIVWTPKLRGAVAHIAPFEKSPLIDDVTRWLKASARELLL